MFEVNLIDRNCGQCGSRNKIYKICIRDSLQDPLEQISRGFLDGNLDHLCNLEKKKKNPTHISQAMSPPRQTQGFPLMR